MAKHYHSDFYQDNLQNRYCKKCFKSFIVGAELSETVEQIKCPYCGSENNEITSWIEDEDLEELGLGCLGIYFHRQGDEVYDRCCRCKEKITEENVLHSGACSNCCK